ncbi:MAG: hypothetical protein JO317_04100 [Verrucomicrobiae bacterium]|nr:hypothetical protein [Verrucomicrobiae bacterium]
MKAATRDTSGIFDSLSIHYAGDEAKFAASKLKVGKSVLTLPSAWSIAPFTELDFQLENPKSKNSKINCRGMVVQCRKATKAAKTSAFKAPKASKAARAAQPEYEIDVLLIDLPTAQQKTLEKISQLA